MARYPTVLAIGDCHFPFANWKTVDRIIAAAAQLRPQHIVQLGDLFDLYAFTRFAKSLNIYTPRQEVKLARKDAEYLWAKLRKAAPRAKRWQLIGNHDERPHKRLMETAPEFEDFAIPALRQLYEFPSVETMPDEAEELMIQGVCYMHGYRKFGDHARHNGVSTVTGHIHKGDVAYMRLGKKTIWELNAGFCANPAAAALSYGKQRRFAKWTQGFGLIDAMGPRFIPLENP